MALEKNIHRETAHHRVSNRSNRFSGMAQLFSGRIGSDFGTVLCISGICSGQVGNGQWKLLLTLPQENISVHRGDFGRKYIYRSELKGLIVARIIAFTL